MEPKSNEVNKLPPTPQSWFDDNRERFKAESIPVKLTGTKCEHYLQRVSGAQIKCRDCKAGWIDTTLTIENGTISR